MIEVYIIGKLFFSKKPTKLFHYKFRASGVHFLCKKNLLILFDVQFMPPTLLESRKLFICASRPIISSISCSEKFFVMPFTLLRIRFR